MNNFPKKIFGLEIRNSALTAVELKYGKTGPRVVNYSRVELDSGVVEDDSIIVNSEAFNESLRKLLLKGKRGPISAKGVVISIPEEKTFNHHINIPKEYADNEEYIKSIASDYIPINLNEAVIDWAILKTKNINQNEVTINFVAVQKNIIELLIKKLSDNGLKVLGVDICENSLVRYCNKTTF